jgi:quaternary ammonium compound-resistance protein SugE
MKMDWIYLFIAAMFEMGWAIGLKYTEGFTRLWPSVLTILGTIASFFFLSVAVKNLPIGTAYAVWTGIGTVGTVLFGIIFLGEPKDLTRVVCILLIVAGIIGLKMSSSSPS